MHKWGLAPTVISECTALNQTASHLVLKCPLHHAPEDIMDCWPWIPRLDAGSTTSPPTFERDLPTEEDCCYSNAVILCSEESALKTFECAAVFWLMHH